MIEVQHVTKRYGPVAAVNDVSFRVEAGQILGFLGPNGAGKTTTMRVLTGYLPPTEGTATIAGFDVIEEPIEAKRRTGYLPETPPLYPDMTVREYLTFVARINGLSASQRRPRIDEVMERTSVGDMADRHCGKLSKGYRQRVGLAQAILHNPDVLVLDEPTAGLDPKQIIETRELIKELAGDHTIILSTHILPEVAQTCERVVIINEGRVVAEDSPDNLTGRLHGAVTIQLQVDTLGADPTDTLQAVPGVASVSVGEPGRDGLRRRGAERPGRGHPAGHRQRGRLQRVGPAGDAPGATQSRRDLSAVDDRGATGRGGRREPERRREPGGRGRGDRRAGPCHGEQP